MELRKADDDTAAVAAVAAVMTIKQAVVICYMALGD